MLRQHSQLIIVARMIADAVAVAVCWLAAYWIRFNFLDAPKGVPDLGDRFLPLLPVIVISHILIFNWIKLYHPRRVGRVRREAQDIIKAVAVAVVTVIVIDYALPDSNKISRKFLGIYAIVSITCFVLFRVSVRVLLRSARRHGWNQRHAAIIGSGRAAQRLLHALRRNTWTGLAVRYFIDDEHPEDPEAAKEVRGLPVRTPLANAAGIIEADPVDSVFIALSPHEAGRLPEILEALQTSMADVRIVPFVSPTFAMRPNISSLDGVPILSLRQTPLYGWNAILKRAFDLTVGSVCLLVAAVPMLAIALAIKLSSRGPVFYRQRRMGLDGREFNMCKFRTMTIDAEADGPVWTQTRPGVRTRIGGFLRRTSLDELPNLFNVLAGEMSLVGPRPERPEFIAQFKEEIPGYMLRHKMKAGMTGIAQVRGYRGDTSLKKRIQHDVHYIRNWSLGLDLRIFLQTVFGVWFHRHEA